MALLLLGSLGSLGIRLSSRYWSEGYVFPRAEMRRSGEMKVREHNKLMMQQQQASLCSCVASKYVNHSQNFTANKIHFLKSLTVFFPFFFTSTETQLGFVSRLLNLIRLLP